MPEENNGKQNQPPEDIFAGIDKPGVEQTQPISAPKPVPPAPTNFAPEYPAPISQRNNFLIIGIFIVIFLALVVAAIILYKFVFAPNQNEIATPAPDIEETTTLPASGLPAEALPAALPAETAPEAEIASADSDADGLTDSDEISAGTNPQKADTDSDGLSDFSEVKQYTTDPLKSDSDDDSFLDGEEILKGYNPKGPGKLLNFQKALQEIKNK